MPYRFIYFDTETTGIRTDKDRIIEIAAYDPERNKKFESFVNPTIPIPAESVKISGITDDMVKDARTIGPVLQDFIDFCEGDVVLVAHNAQNFDLPLLKAEASRVQVELPSHWLYLDSLHWARKYRRDLPRHSLQYLRQAFDIPPNQAHRALDDVLMLEEVFSILIDDLTPEQVLERISPIRSNPTQGAQTLPQQYELIKQ